MRLAVMTETANKKAQTLSVAAVCMRKRARQSMSSADKEREAARPVGGVETLDAAEEPAAAAAAAAPGFEAIALRSRDAE